MRLQWVVELGIENACKKSCEHETLKFFFPGGFLCLGAGSEMTSKAKTGTKVGLMIETAQYESHVVEVFRLAVHFLNGTMTKESPHSKASLSFSWQQLSN